MNNSWGCPEIEGCDADSLRPAVAALRQAGIFVVASAGNDGPRCESLTHPLAIYEEAFSVGSVDSAGALSSFSSIGPVWVDGSGRTKP
ncbi:S8 family serine peptidase, partial [Arthrospira platensis SPKY2]